MARQRGSSGLAGVDAAGRVRPVEPGPVSDPGPDFGLAFLPVLIVVKYAQVS